MLNKKERSGAEAATYICSLSIVADRELEAGSIITELDIWARRPGTGEIAGFDFDKLIGRVLNKPLKKNTQLSWSDID